MVNVYTEGGAFTRHRDREHLTVLVPLNQAEEAFIGGGTAFYSSGASSSPPAVVARPVAGTALLWTGDVEHAGLAVKTGTRIVYVGSFSLEVHDLPIHTPTDKFK